MVVDVKSGAAKAEAGARTQDPEGTQENIIEVATQEFAEYGLAGARIDEIAAKTKSSKRMIYYYFGDKEGLYLRVLEAAYSKVRAVEATLDLDDLQPLEALRRLVEFTFDHHNCERALHPPGDDREHPPRRIPRPLEGHPGAERDRHRHDLAALRARREGGRVPRGIDPIDLHWQISALCFFNVSNRATFSKIFSRDLEVEEGARASARADRRDGRALRPRALTTRQLSHDSDGAAIDRSSTPPTMNGPVR